MPRFEEKLAARCGAAHAVVGEQRHVGVAHRLPSARAGGRAIGCGLRRIRFVASANCALHCGAQVDFVDVDPQSLELMCPKELEKKARL